MTKDEAISMMDEALKEYIPDHNLRWTVIERIYRDVVKPCEADARDYAERLLFSKPE